MSENEEKEPEEVIEEPPYEHQVVLDNQMVQTNSGDPEKPDGLMQLYRVPNGSTFAYGTLILDEKELVSITDVNRKSETFDQCILANYPYLRVLKLNINQLTELDKIKNCDFLIEVQASENQIASLGFLTAGVDKLQYLQKVNLSKNQLTCLPQIDCESLKYLNLEENQIKTCEIKSHQSLRYLNLNKNKLKNGKGIAGLKSLETLTLQENEISTCKGMERMPKLKKLDLTGNKMERTHSLCDVPSVTELILDGNPISSMKEFMKIAALKQLASLSMMGCPFADEKGDDFRKEVLIQFHKILPSLKVINGEAWTAEEMEEAMTEIKNREDAKAEEEAAKKAAKEEGGEEAVPAPEPSDSEACEASAGEEGEPVPKKTLNEDELEALWYQFQAMDENKDGLITAKELRRILREIGDDFSNKQCNRMIKTVDKDGDGMISFEEFCKNVEKPPEPVEAEPEE